MLLLLSRNCFLVIFLVFILQKKEVNSKISVRDNWLVDEYGRVRLFHGFNAVMKNPPWYDAQFMNKTRLEYFKSWGFNAVRLGTMWSGVEPEENKFNETYIDVLYNASKTLDTYGMFVLLDVHQDVFSSAVCDTCYDGFPAWLSKNFTPSILKYPWPFNYIPEEKWAFGYFTYSVSSAFQQFYDNVSGAVDKFVRFWLKVVNKFKNQNNILGYELLNEPWAGNIYLNPRLLLSGVAGSKNLKPLYDRLFTEINKIDNKTNIFYEPVTWGVMGRGDLIGSGFNELPGGDAFRNRSVFSYHMYCWILNMNALHSDFPWFIKLICDSLFARNIFLNVADTVRKIGGSSFLTEFGLCEPDGNPISIDTLQCNSILEKSDKYLQSWTYWDSSFFDNNGFPKLPVVRSFSRPYAMATAGIPTRMKFNKEEQIFEYEFKSKAAIQQPTVIFIPSVHYPANVGVVISPQLRWVYDKSTSLLTIYPSDLPDNTPVSMTISSLK